MERRGQNWQNIFINLFHVLGRLDHFERPLFFGTKVKGSKPWNGCRGRGSSPEVEKVVQSVNLVDRK